MWKRDILYQHLNFHHIVVYLASQFPPKIKCAKSPPGSHNLVQSYTEIQLFQVTSNQADFIILNKRDLLNHHR